VKEVELMALRLPTTLRTLLLVVAYSLVSAANGISESWVITGHAPPANLITVRLALAQRNLDELEQRFWQISDPRSPMYGDFMTAAEIGVLIGQHDNVEQIKTWAGSLGCVIAQSVVETRDYVHLTMPVSCAERAFAVKLYSFLSADQKQSLIWSQAPPKLPLQSIVVAIHGLEVPMTVKRRLRRVSAEGQISKEPGDQVTPAVLASLYGYTSDDTTNYGAAVALAEFEDDCFIPSDIQTFLSNYSLPKHNITRIVGFDDTVDGYLAESSLDVQYAMAVAGPSVDAWAFIVDSNLGFDLTAWALNVTGTPGAPKVHSISWGSPETEFKAEDMERDNTEFQKMGAMGFTILVASGDNGPGKQGFFSCKKFNPQFPATSPYVTAVGGTYLEDGHETGWGFSGGGFSNMFPMPQYQQASVAAYLSSASLPSAKLFNQTGRAIPDISGVATNYRVLMQGFWDEAVSGTSASSPVWAGLLALVNNHRLANGKKVLGFLNPALYQLGTGVGQDIKTGENKASGCKEGFKASAGWDPVTGWGTPSFQALLKALGDDLP